MLANCAYDICFSLNVTFSVQEFFVRKSNAKKGMFASTHLVLKEPGGSKYEAAKKWNLPAVTIAWLLETARLGKRANESHFLIKNSPKEGSYFCFVLLCIYFYNLMVSGI